jgi:hypothetical protein
MSVLGRLLGRQHDRVVGLGRLDSVVRLRRKPRWAEAWQTYPGAVGDAPALWSVDLGAVEVAPMIHLPVRIDVEIGYAAKLDGLPADLAHVAQVEDAVRASVVGLGGVYIGRVAGSGRCRFTAHIPAEPAAPVRLTAARVSTEYDPHWAYVRDTLAPDERQHRLLADLAVVDVLAEHGDPLSTPREVAHVAFFAEQAAAEHAAVDLRAAGFAASVERDDEGDFALTALRADPVAPPTVHELTWGVKEIVERHGGTYDGWNCGLASAA